MPGKVFLARWFDGSNAGAWDRFVSKLLLSKRHEADSAPGTLLFVRDHSK